MLICCYLIKKDDKLGPIFSNLFTKVLCDPLHIRAVLFQMRVDMAHRVRSCAIALCIGLGNQMGPCFACAENDFFRSQATAAATAGKKRRRRT